VEVVTERVVAGPPPHQGDGARELRGLVGVARGVVGAVVDRAVGRDLVDHLAAVVVGRHAAVTQGAEVRLDVAELAHRHGGEGGVLPVGAEQPGVVGPAGTQPAGARKLAPARRARSERALASLPWLAVYWFPSLTGRSCRSCTSWTESARFCLLHATLRSSSRSPGRSTTVRDAICCRAATFCARAVAGSCSALVSWVRAASTPWSEPATANPTGVGSVADQPG